MGFVFQMATVKHIVKRQSTVKEETKKRRAKFPSISQDKKRYEVARKKMASRRTMRRNRRTMATKEPKVVAEVEPEIHFDVETQVKPPQPSAREELVATLHPLTPDMPTGEEFLSGWTNVIGGGTSTSSIMTAVTPVMVTAGVMHQLVSTPGIQVTTIPITIPLTTVTEAAPITLQSHLWVKGHQPEREDSERVVEVELDQEQSKSQGEDPRKEGDMQEGSQEEEALEAGEIQEKPEG